MGIPIAIQYNEIIPQQVKHLTVESPTKGY